MAKMKQCKDCKANIPKSAKKCMHCGSKQGINIGSGGLFLILIAVIYMGSTMIPDKSETKAPAKSIEQIKAEGKAAAEKRAAHEKSIRDEFGQKRDSIIANVKDLISKGAFAGAKKLANKFRIVGDSELDGLSDQAHEKDLLARVKVVPASELKKNRDLYSQLAGMRPENQRYKNKLKHYQSKIDKQKIEALARKLAFGDPPLSSGWDGSYRAVNRYLEQTAHDPDSIDIDRCTEVFQTKKGWLVGCIYRGKNAFGGLIRNANWFTIVHDNVIKMEPSDRYKW